MKNCGPPDVSARLAMYRATRGRLGGRMIGLDVVLLTTTGARSGAPRTMPLCTLRDGDRFVLIASAGGSPSAKSISSCGTASRF